DKTVILGRCALFWHETHLLMGGPASVLELWRSVAASLKFFAGSTWENDFGIRPTCNAENTLCIDRRSLSAQRNTGFSAVERSLEQNNHLGRHVTRL
ncbi:MAG: hypothetical protein J6A65_12725, partial [Pseudomonas sp.]|nr:hypothetical protein [Pseudomonas sp.]